MNQLTFDYQLADDNGVSQVENVPLLIPIGSKFKHEYGEYLVTSHLKSESGYITPWCERINKDGLK